MAIDRTLLLATLLAGVVLIGAESATREVDLGIVGPPDVANCGTAGLRDVQQI
jgi:hypothetical protein